MIRVKGLPQLAALAVIGISLGACQVIAGIEDRKLDPTAPQRKLCSDYCSLVMDACQNEFEVYKTPEQCLAVCNLLPPGDQQESDTDNTVRCRMHEADLAKREPQDHCPSAGPGGNGVCGTDCDAYCTLFPQVCPKYFEYDHDSCLKACSGLTDQNRFDVTADHGGDTLECRLVHTSAASVEPDAHCPHATIPPSEPYCTGNADAAPTCDEYCNIELAACDGDLLQYEDRPQCMATCKALDLGKNKDRAENTVGCRRYHAFTATLSPDIHCYHSGPTGDGHCGDKGTVKDGHTGNCDSYCRLLANACTKEFDREFSGSLDQCKEECVGLPEADLDSKYTLPKALVSKGLQCRVLNTVRALTGADTCEAAFGGGDCQ